MSEPPRLIHQKNWTKPGVRNGITGAINGWLSIFIFGPLGLIVRGKDADAIMSVAKCLVGQLTCTLHVDDNDTQLAQAMMPVLEQKAGRVLANGFPTDVDVADTMVQGGPYPVSTNSGATSVGTLSIRRFLRPVCYQSIPSAILPVDPAKY